jgi:large subunit ribosomal protein L1
MGPEQLEENYLALMTALQKAKPATSKGNYFRAIALSTTNGVGIKLDVAETVAKLS